MNFCENDQKNTLKVCSHPFRIVQGIEVIASKIQTTNKSNTNDIFQISTKRIAMAVLPTENANTFTGDTINIISQSTDGTVQFQRNRWSEDQVDTRKAVSIKLPATLIADAATVVNGQAVTSIQFVYFTDASLFPVIGQQNDEAPSGTNTVVSGVFSLKVGGQEYLKLTEDVEFDTSVTDGTGVGAGDSRGEYSCVYWDFDAKGK